MSNTMLPPSDTGLCPRKAKPAWQAVTFLLISDKVLYCPFPHHDQRPEDEAHGLEEGEERDVTCPLCHEGGGGHVEPGGGVDGGAGAHDEPRHQHHPHPAHRGGLRSQVKHRIERVL